MRLREHAPILVVLPFLCLPDQVMFSEVSPAPGWMEHRIHYYNFLNKLQKGTAITISIYIFISKQVVSRYQC